MGGRGQGMAYYVKYRFTLPDGRAFTPEQIVSRRTLANFHKGQTVPIKYLADNPTIAALIGIAQDNTLDLGNLAMFLIGGAGLLSDLGLIGYLSWQMWREEQFFTRGHVLTGHVLACHSHLESAPKNLTVQVYDPKPRGRYMLDLSYTFRDPSGAPIKTSVERQRNDLQAAPLPKFGHPIAVLYLARNVTRSFEKLKAVERLHWPDLTMESLARPLNVPTLFIAVAMTTVPYGLFQIMSSPLLCARRLTGQPPCPVQKRSEDLFGKYIVFIRTLSFNRTRNNSTDEIALHGKKDRQR
jgi:hypothetical protein